jgi:D-alanyl-D-alanine carboxypeptidase
VNDVPQEPEPAERPEDAEHEPGRTATAEFRIPAPAPAKNASLTRPDIRRPARPAENAPPAADDPEPSGEAPDEAPEGEEADTSAPLEDEAAEETPEQDAEPEADSEPQDAEPEDADAADERPEEPQKPAEVQEEELEADTARAEPEESAEPAEAAPDAGTAHDQGAPPAPPEDAGPAQDPEDEPAPSAEPPEADEPEASWDDEPDDPDEPEASWEDEPDEPEAAEESAAPGAEEHERPGPAQRSEAAPRPEPPAEPPVESPAAVTRVERLPAPWQLPAPEAPPAPPAEERQGGQGGQGWFESPRQSPGPVVWDAPRQAPPGEFRPESVRWDAAPQNAAPQNAAPQGAPPQNAASYAAAAQGAAPPVRPVQSGPWEVAVPQAPAPAPPAAEAEKRPKRRGLVIVLVAALVLVVGVVAGQLIRPVPDPTVKLSLASSHVFPGAAPALPWPAVGQSTVYVDGLGTMGSSGGSAPTPTASVAKVMTAFVYLRDHPLATGQAGPVLAVSPQGVAEIPARKKRGESLLGITAGQRLTERKALEALLIISANDLAHELARWDSGGDQPFVAKMNAAARDLGMTATRYTDPSGYDSGTVSTAADQVKLLRAAMKVPAFTEIVNRRAYVPDDGSPARPGGNVLVGQYGVVGGKTGYTDAAGGNYVFAARRKVGGVPTLILGAVMAQKSPSAQGAVEAAGRLIQAVEGSMTAATLAPKGARVGTVDDGLGGSTPLRAASPVTVVGWPGLRVPVGIQGDPPHQGAAGERVGQVTAGAARVPLVLGSSLDEPSYLKRLVRVN